MKRKHSASSTNKLQEKSNLQKRLKQLNNYSIYRVKPDRTERKHTKINNHWANSLRGMDEVHKNIEFRRRGSAMGELDIFAYRWTSKGLYGYIIETKSSYNPKLEYKANRQLKRGLEKFIPLVEKADDVKFDKVFVYYANPTELNIKNKQLGYYL